MKSSTIFKFGILTVSSVFAQVCDTILNPNVDNSCVTFQVGQGTGCSWMCNYCANTLGTNSYYFTTPVCTYQPGVGCIGTPQSGVSYTCCTTN